MTPAVGRTLCTQRFTTLSCVQYLRLPGERIMRLAEELYQAGVISYPRTETDMFDQQYELQVGWVAG